MHRASILPPRGVFAVRSPQTMHGARTLPPSGGPAPAQGLLPEQPHRGIAFQRPGPCAGMTSHTGRGSRTLLNGLALAQGCLPQRPANTRHLPMPATCQCPPLANTCRSLHPLQSGTSRRWASAAIVRRTACSPAKPRGAADCVVSTGRPTTECCAELGLDSRTVSKWAQNRRLSPQARPGLRQRCQKRPSKGRVPLDGTIGAPPTLLRAISN